MENLVSQGFELALIGMGTVFVFLTVLVIAMTVMSRLVIRLQPAAVAAEAAPTGGDEEIAAIAAAITEHRRQ